MLLLTSEQMNTGAGMGSTFYTLTTTFDFNPENGDSAKKMFNTVKGIIQERAEINDDIIFRVYANDGTFPLDGINKTDTNLRIFQYVFGVVTHSNGWTNQMLTDALQTSSAIRAYLPPTNYYSINKKQSIDNGYKFQYQTVDGLKSAPPAQMYISDKIPTSNQGHNEDQLFVLVDNTLSVYFKLNDEWKNVTNDILFEGIPDTNTKYALNAETLSLHIYDGTKYGNAELMLVSGTPRSIDRLWALPANNHIEVSRNIATDVWEPIKFYNMGVIDANSWFSDPTTTLINPVMSLLSGNEALVGFDVSLLEAGTGPSGPDVTTSNTAGKLYVNGTDSIGAWRIIADTTLKIQHKGIADWANNVTVTDKVLNVKGDSESIGMKVSMTDQSIGGTLPTAVDHDIAGAKVMRVSHGRDGVGGDQLVISQNDPNDDTKVINKFVVKSDIITGQIETVTSGGQRVKVYTVGTGAAATVARDLEILTGDSRLDKSAIKGLDTLEFGEMFKGYVDSTTLLSSFNPRRRFNYWIVQEDNITLGGQAFRANDIIMCQVDSIVDPVDLNDMDFRFLRVKARKADYDRSGDLKVVHNAGLSVGTDGALAVAYEGTEFTLQGDKLSLLIDQDKLVKTPAGLSVRLGAMFTSTLADGLKIRTDETLVDKPDHTLGVDATKLDILLMKNVSLLNKGNYRGAIPLTTAGLADARKGDWWKASQTGTIFSTTYNMGDELYCVVDTTGVPADAANFAFIANVNSVMMGATALADGQAGMVPSPRLGDESKILYGDGTWKKAPAGGLESHDPTKSFDKGRIVLYKGIMARANDAIPANTPFAWGVTGLTWSLETSGTWKGVFALNTAYSTDDVVAMTTTTVDDFHICYIGNAGETELPALTDRWRPYYGSGIAAEVFRGVDEISPNFGKTGLVPGPYDTQKNMYLSSAGGWSDPKIMTDTQNSSSHWKIIVENGKPYLTDIV